MDPKFLLAIALTLPLCAQVKITAQGKEKISVEIDGKPFTDFYVGPETAKPYLHPLRTADGKVVTRGFPMVTDIPWPVRQPLSSRPRQGGCDQEWVRLIP